MVSIKFCFKLWSVTHLQKSAPISKYSSTYHKMITSVTIDQVKSENDTLQPLSEPHFFLHPKGHHCPDFHPSVLLFVIVPQMGTMLHWEFIHMVLQDYDPFFSVAGEHSTWWIFEWFPLFDNCEQTYEHSVYVSQCTFACFSIRHISRCGFLGQKVNIHSALGDNTQQFPKPLYQQTVHH